MEVIYVWKVFKKVGYEIEHVSIEQILNKELNYIKIKAKQKMFICLNL